MVYLKGGDLELAVKNAANTVLHNQGQTCSALTRCSYPKMNLNEQKKS